MSWFSDFLYPSNPKARKECEDLQKQVQGLNQTVAADVQVFNKLLSKVKVVICNNGALTGITVPFSYTNEDVRGLISADLVQYEDPQWMQAVDQVGGFLLTLSALTDFFGSIQTGAEESRVLAADLSKLHGALSQLSTDQASILAKTKLLETAATNAIHLYQQIRDVLSSFDDPAWPIDVGSEQAFDIDQLDALISDQENTLERNMTALQTVRLITNFRIKHPDFLAHQDSYLGMLGDTLDLSAEIITRLVNLQQKLAAITNETPAAQS